MKKMFISQQEVIFVCWSIDSQSLANQIEFKIRLINLHLKPTTSLHHYCPGVIEIRVSGKSLFLRKIVWGRLRKNYATAVPSAAPAVLLLALTPNRGLRNDWTPCRKACIFTTQTTLRENIYPITPGD